MILPVLHSTSRTIYSDCEHIFAFFVPLSLSHPCSSAFLPLLTHIKRLCYLLQSLCIVCAPRMEPHFKAHFFRWKRATTFSKSRSVYTLSYFAHRSRLATNMCVLHQTHRLCPTYATHTHTHSRMLESRARQMYVLYLYIFLGNYVFNILFMRFFTFLALSRAHTFLQWLCFCSGLNCLHLGRRRFCLINFFSNHEFVLRCFAWENMRVARL